MPPAGERGSARRRNRRPAGKEGSSRRSSRRRCRSTAGDRGCTADLPGRRDRDRSPTRAIGPARRRARDAGPRSLRAPDLPRRGGAPTCGVALDRSAGINAGRRCLYRTRDQPTRKEGHEEPHSIQGAAYGAASAAGCIGTRPGDGRCSCGRNPGRSGECRAPPQGRPGLVCEQEAQVQASDAQARSARDRGHQGERPGRSSPQNPQPSHPPGRRWQQRLGRLQLQAQEGQEDRRQCPGRRRPRAHRRKERCLHRQNPDEDRRRSRKRHPGRRLRSRNAARRRRERLAGRKQRQRPGAPGRRR